MDTSKKKFIGSSKAAHICNKIYPCFHRCCSCWGEQVSLNVTFGLKAFSPHYYHNYLVCLTCWSDEKIALLGAIQSLFEGSMYTFVFLWTPALSPNNEEIPHGFIFATFMLASMLGSSLASRLLARASLRVENYMQIVFIVSAASLVLPIVTSVSVFHALPHYISKDILSFQFIFLSFWILNSSW